MTDWAEYFLFHLSHPRPHMRGTRLYYLWFRTLVSMLDEMGIASVVLTLLSMSKTCSKPGECAALCGCCFGASPLSGSVIQLTEEWLL